MSSYFPFSTSTPSTSLGSDDPHLEVTVHPSASAFYAGETFSVTITFRNTRPPPADTAGSSTSSIVPSASDHRDETGGPSDVPHRRKQIGLNINSRPLNAEAGPSRTLNTLDLTSTPIASEPGYPYSSGANPTYRAPGLAGSPERDELSNIRSPDSWKRKENGGSRRDEGHARRTRSLALGKGGMSPQEMVWALGGQSGE